MDVEKVAAYPVARIDTFLDNFDFGRELVAGKTTEAPEFRVQGRKFLN